MCALAAYPFAAAPQQSSDIPKTFVPNAGYDYVKRDVMIPMRDGVKLHTVIVVPKGASNAPIFLTRTPYNASKRTDAQRQPAHAFDPSARRMKCSFATATFACSRTFAASMDRRATTS